LAQIRLETELERAKCRSAREARKAEEATLVKDGEQYARELVAARLQRFELAEQKEAVARAAASPLARLTWNRPQQSQVSLLSRVKPTPDTRINVSAEINTSLTFWQGSDLAVHGQTAAVTV
jgi:hypothetical protein